MTQYLISYMVYVSGDAQSDTTPIFGDMIIKTAEEISAENFEEVREIARKGLEESVNNTNQFPYTVKIEAFFFFNIIPLPIKK